MSGALTVYVLVVSSATTAGSSSMSDVRWLRADEYSMNALNTGTGSMESTLHSAEQHSMAQHSTCQQAPQYTVHQTLVKAVGGSSIS